MELSVTLIPTSKKSLHFKLAQLFARAVQETTWIHQLTSLCHFCFTTPFPCTSYRPKHLRVTAAITSLYSEMLQCFLRARYYSLITVHVTIRSLTYHIRTTQFIFQFHQLLYNVLHGNPPPFLLSRITYHISCQFLLNFLSSEIVLQHFLSFISLASLKNTGYAFLAGIIHKFFF